jgi:hypothetical protein
MKIQHLMVLALVVSAGPAFAGTPDAKVTESVNEVHYGPSLASVETLPAPTGTLVRDGSYVTTGTASRAELTFPSQSITRLGSNTIFNYNAEENQVDLTAGTILFCKPKDAPERLNIKTEALSAGITGTTGFVNVVPGKSGQPTLYLFGLIEGHATAHAGGKSFDITSGEFLLVRPGQPSVLLNFDVHKLVATSPLLTKFKHHLPNAEYIAAAVDNYDDEVQRGFIVVPGKGPGPNLTTGDLPGVPVTSFDSALNAPRGGGGGDTRPSTPDSYNSH